MPASQEPAPTWEKEGCRGKPRQMPPAFPSAASNGVKRKKLLSPLESQHGKGEGKDWDQKPIDSRSWGDIFPAAVLMTSLCLLPLFLSLGSFSSFCSSDGVPAPQLLSLSEQLLPGLYSCSAFMGWPNPGKPGRSIPALCWWGRMGMPCH